jgi:hypothetical protein
LTKSPRSSADRAAVSKAVGRWFESNRGLVAKKEHPCAAWCAGTLDGIVANLKLCGELPEDFDVTFKSLRGLMYVPGGSYILKCRHGRDYLAVVVDK